MKDFWCEAEFDKESAGEMILLIRQRSGMITADFANSIDVSARDLTIAENGKGAHVFAILDKICKKYGFKTTLKIEGV